MRRKTKIAQNVEQSQAIERKKDQNIEIVRRRGEQLSNNSSTIKMFQIFMVE